MKTLRRFAVHIILLIAIAWPWMILAENTWRIPQGIVWWAVWLLIAAPISFALSLLIYRDDGKLVDGRFTEVEPD